MKTKLFTSIFFILLLLTSFNLKAQSGGLNFTLGFPMDEFKDNVDRLGFGISGQFLLFDPSPRLPFGFGINIGFLNYGSESRTEPFSSTIPDVFVDVDRTNNLDNFHLLFQVAPPYGTFRPYLEGLIGGSYIYTETTIRSRGDDDVASSTNFDDFAWSYGGGAGLLIQVTPFDWASSFAGSIHIDLKARYLFGTEAEYLAEGSITVDQNNGNVYYDIMKSKTDLLTFHIGVTAYFNSF